MLLTHTLRQDTLLARPGQHTVAPVHLSVVSDHCRLDLALMFVLDPCGTGTARAWPHVLAEDGAPPDGLPLPRLLRYSAQTLGALHELHSMGVVMADLKPQNLLLDADLDEVVLTDFGISKILSNTVGSYTGTVMGQGTLYTCKLQSQDHVALCYGVLVAAVHT